MNLAKLLGKRGPRIERQRSAAQKLLNDASTQELLSNVGRIIKELPRAHHFTKDLFQRSYVAAERDMVVGKGLFFVDEQNRLYLDCTSGHYQMSWGYTHPVLCQMIRECMERGVAWDGHSNIPGDPVKKLANTLLAGCNADIPPGGDVVRGLREAPEKLSRVNIGTATGSAACSTAIKMALKYYRERYMDLGAPVVITHAGNYHGTDIFAQRMRGMWQDFFAGSNVEFVVVQPNDLRQLERTFERCGRRCALFMAEPVMMNREATLIGKETMQLARHLCDYTDALLAVDEIQTAFWQPGLFMYKTYDVVPDAVVVGKGMTAGFHPLSATIFKSKFDNLEQYDSLSTNGGAPLAACVALANVELIKKHKRQIEETAEMYHNALKDFAAEFPDHIEAVQGAGYLGGLKFKDRQMALQMHKRCVEQGLWLRVHAYHKGHSTLLTKFCLLLDSDIIGFFIQKLRGVLNSLTAC